MQIRWRRLRNCAPAGRLYRPTSWLSGLRLTNAGLAHSGAILALNRDGLLNHRGRSLAFLEVGGAASQSQPASKPAKKLEQPQKKDFNAVE